MTRDEAIDLLDNLIGMIEDNHESDYDTAFKMAIQALEQEPKAEKSLFIKMRDVTPEEQEAIDRYIKSISKPTGVNFWDLADGEYITQSAGDEIRQKNYDLISRQAVLDMWRQEICYGRTCHARDEGRCTETFCDFKLFEYKINHMPSVKPQESKWIPVSERLPKIAGIYRVTRYYPNNVMNPNYLVDACCFDGSNTWYDDNRINYDRAYADNVIAWQENPEPYKVEPTCDTCEYNTAAFNPCNACKDKSEYKSLERSDKE